MYNYIAPCNLYSKSGHLVYCVLYVLIIHNTNNTYSVLCNTASFYASRLSSRDATRNAQNEHNKAAAAQQQQLRRSSSSGAAAALAQQQLWRSSSSGAAAVAGGGITPAMMSAERSREIFF